MTAGKHIPMFGVLDNTIFVLTSHPPGNIRPWHLHTTDGGSTTSGIFWKMGLSASQWRVPGAHGDIRRTRNVRQDIRLKGDTHEEGCTLEARSQEGLEDSVARAAWTPRSDDT